MLKILLPLAATLALGATAHAQGYTNADCDPPGRPFVGAPNIVNLCADGKPVREVIKGDALDCPENVLLWEAQQFVDGKTDKAPKQELVNGLKAVRKLMKHPSNSCQLAYLRSVAKAYAAAAEKMGDEIGTRKAGAAVDPKEQERLRTAADEARKDSLADLKAARKALGIAKRKKGAAPPAP